MDIGYLWSLIMSEKDIRSENEFLKLKIKALEMTLSKTCPLEQYSLLKIQNNELERLLKQASDKLSQAYIDSHSYLQKYITLREDIYYFAKSQAIEFMRYFRASARTKEEMDYSDRLQTQINHFIFNLSHLRDKYG